MAAWLMVVCGCFLAGLGAATLRGWRAAQYRRPMASGTGLVLLGLGLALDGVPRLADWSSRTGLLLATVGLALVALGAVLQIVGGTFLRTRR